MKIDDARSAYKRRLERAELQYMKAKEDLDLLESLSGKTHIPSIISAIGQMMTFTFHLDTAEECSVVRSEFQPIPACIVDGTEVLPTFELITNKKVEKINSLWAWKHDGKMEKGCRKANPVWLFQTSYEICWFAVHDGRIVRISVDSENDYRREVFSYDRCASFLFGHTLCYSLRESDEKEG